MCESPMVWWLQCTSFFNKSDLQRIFVRSPLTNQICGTVVQIYDPSIPKFVCVDEKGVETMKIYCTMHNSMDRRGMTFM